MMVLLDDFAAAIGKTLVEVREATDDTFDDAVEYQLLIFNDNTGTLVQFQSTWTETSCVQPEPSKLSQAVRAKLGL